MVQCGRPGTPSGGPKDVTPPELIRAVPDNMSVNFDAKKIRLYFDEYIKLQDIQSQLIVSPPLKYPPQITPQGGASKFIDIILKDTLKENTTYTFNFGQSIIDNNEGNPNSFLTYTFSTGTYIDSLEVFGVVKDAFKRNPETFISILLYEIDSTYTDSTVYQKPPNYITNTLDSLKVFRLQNLKEGNYAIFGIKDLAKNNVFDQNGDKIAFLKDTITLPTDEIYELTLFKEVPDYNASIPSFAANNRILFGYQGEYDSIKINTLTQLPDSVRTLITKEPEKDTLNYWITPFEADSLVFRMSNSKFKVVDTFTVKPRKLEIDSLILTASHRGSIGFKDEFHIAANTPITAVDSLKFMLINKDSLEQPFKIEHDTLGNKVNIDFDLEPNESYNLTVLPGAISDFFKVENDTLNYRLSTGSYVDYGDFDLTLRGNITYPIIVQLTNQSEEVVREIYATSPQLFSFRHLRPGTYYTRIIFDENENKKWDSGSYLKRLQPEKVVYIPKILDMRANWEEKFEFIFSE